MNPSGLFHWSLNQDDWFDFFCWFALLSTLFQPCEWNGFWFWPAKNQFISGKLRAKQISPIEINFGHLEVLFIVLLSHYFLSSNSLVILSFFTSSSSDIHCGTFVTKWSILFCSGEKMSEINIHLHQKFISHFFQAFLSLRHSILPSNKGKKNKWIDSRKGAAYAHGWKSKQDWKFEN